MFYGKVFTVKESYYEGHAIFRLLPLCLSEKKSAVLQDVRSLGGGSFSLAASFLFSMKENKKKKKYQVQEIHAPHSNNLPNLRRSLTFPVVLSKMSSAQNCCEIYNRYFTRIKRLHPSANGRFLSQSGETEQSGGLFTCQSRLQSEILENIAAAHEEFGLERKAMLHACTHVSVVLVLQYFTCTWVKWSKSLPFSSQLWSIAEVPLRSATPGLFSSTHLPRRSDRPKQEIKRVQHPVKIQHKAGTSDGK